MVLAEAEARDLGHPEIGTGHLLLGAVRAGAGAGAGGAVGTDALRGALVRRAGIGDAEPGGSLPFTPRAQAALQAAARAALRIPSLKATPDQLATAALADPKATAREILAAATPALPAPPATVAKPAPAPREPGPASAPEAETQADEPPQAVRDAELLLDMLARSGHAAAFLAAHGVDADAVRMGLADPDG